MYAMDVTRRDFLHQGIGTVSVLGFSLLKMPGMQQVCEAADAKKVAEIPVVWMANGSCSGCSVSLLNSASPSIQEALLAEVIPGMHLSLGFHATVMAAAGDLAMEAMNKLVAENKGKYVLVVDGATATKDDGLYCAVGEVDGKPITGYQHVRDLGRDAMAVLSVGACAAFGGIPAADPNPTGAVSVMELLKREGIETPVVNIPGCPPHPDWIVGTIATILLGDGDLQALKLDEHGRPAPFFTPLIHDNCPYRGHFDNSDFAEHFGEHGCLVKLGCKGPITHADCPLRKWNNGTSWCVEAGHPCIGCCEPEFPYDKSMFTPVEPAQMTFPGIYPPAAIEHQGPDKGTYAAVGAVGAAGFLAGVGITAAAKKLKSEQDAEGSGTGSEA
ncbi:MAG: hydrogenase small subunit [Planctomycetota bacterium]|nr:MAG: hydrogenase small subunit [Planctomycetota bacterium]